MGINANSSGASRMEPELGWNGQPSGEGRTLPRSLGNGEKEVLARIRELLLGGPLL